MRPSRRSSILVRPTKALINLLEHSPASDAARSAILKLYSYETPLYGALNRANQCQDRSKINSLGPFAMLLYKTLWYPPTANVTKQKGKHGVKWRDDRLTLYRGLGLPAKAL